MRQIKIFFEDFWQGFNDHSNFIIDILEKEFDIMIDPNPDYLFFSVYGYNHLKYRNCIKIFYSGENIEPDFNLCDYAIAFQFINAGDRYLRYPLYLMHGFEQLNNQPFDIEMALNRKFCNFVYSNNKWADPIRENFYKKLSKYKKIDSGGKFLNNMGAQVKNKLDFIKEYKFTIAFENSSLSGYTTEKIVEPMVVNSMPIYWGNPDIDLDFNKHSFIYVNDYETMDEVINEIVRLDNDDKAYIQKLSIPWYCGDNYEQWKLKLSSFLKNIINQEYAKAKRITNYGFVRTYRRKQETMGWLFSRKIMRLTIANYEFSLLIGKKK